MLDRLVDFLLDSLRSLAFWTVVQPYERRVVTRLGRYSRTLDPGFHFVWPLNIEAVMRDNVVPRTVNLDPQSLTTADNVQLVISAIITYGIRDLKVFVLEVEHADQLLADNTYGLIAELVTKHTYKELRTSDLPELLTTKLRRVAWRWGVELHKVTLSDFTRARSHRLWQSHIGGSA